MNLKKIVSELTLEEKAGLCSGADFWKLKSIEREGIPSIMLTDGPNGLRKQNGSTEQLGMEGSVPATCFPTACCTANSWDPELMYQMGEALGEETRAEHVSVLLGPGVNIKRSPLCGRNFEYFSEDPLLAGELAAGMINGVQSKGVGTSLKHFAANNQEKNRLVCDSVIDERALREIYLPAFEIAVKKAQPRTVMCSYNKINGTYACENEKLLTKILKEEWGHEGIVVTDWGATDERTECLAAGNELEMPSSGGVNDAKIVKAVRSGALSEEKLDRAVERILALIEKSLPALKEPGSYDKKAHHQLARKVARESMVLLKNNGVLPFEKEKTFALIGAFAKEIRYQGAGSSQIVPTMLDTPYDAFKAEGIEFEYAQGYRAQDEQPDEQLIAQAVETAQKAQQVVVFVGLPDGYESEGFDRTHMHLPECQNHLVERLADVCADRMTVVFVGGAPVELLFADRVGAILSAYLGGQACGSAITDLLLGKANPCGKLAETWPLRLEDTPCHPYYCRGNERVAHYRESVFVGYRYYDTAKAPVCYPFGHGLSYTTFEYSDLKLSAEKICADETLSVQVTVKNTGETAGAEIAQLYVSGKESSLIRPEKELRAFKKVYLQPGEETVVHFELDMRAFAYYSTALEDWNVESGTYEIRVGASSRDIRLKAQVNVESLHPEVKEQDLHASAPAYYNVGSEVWKEGIPEEQFRALYAQEFPPLHPDIFDLNSTIGEVMADPIGREMIGKIPMPGIFEQPKAENADGGKSSSDKMFEAMMREMPLRSLIMLSGGKMTPDMLDQILNGINQARAAEK